MSERFLLVSVYSDRDGQDCSIRGASTKDNAYHIVSCKSGNFKVDDIDRWEKSGKEVVIWDIRTRNLGSDTYINARPRCVPENVWTMAGGSFIYSCDSRFRSDISPYPVPCHDRVEG